MLVPWKALNGTHRRTSQCDRSAEQEQWRLVAEEEREVTTRSLSTYGCPLEMVTSFRYLGQIISVADDNWPEVVKNFSRAREVSRRMTQILSREGAAPQVSGLFFKAVVQVVLLFGSENWVVTPPMW